MAKTTDFFRQITQSSRLTGSFSWPTLRLYFGVLPALILLSWQSSIYGIPPHEAKSQSPQDRSSQASNSKSKLEAQPTEEDFYAQDNIQVSLFFDLLADLSLHPENVTPYLELSQAFLHIGEPEMALELLARARQIQDHSAAQGASNLQDNSGAIALQEVAIFMETGEIEAARGSLLVLLPTQPNNPVAHQYMGDIYLLEDNLELALESYSQAVRFSTLSSALASRLGNVWMKKGDYLMAIVYYRHWVNSSPNNPAAYYSLGIALRNRERVDEARFYLQTSADLYLRLGNTENFEKVHGILKTMMPELIATP